MNADALDQLIARELPAATGGCARAYGRIVEVSQNTVTAVALAITRDVPASEDIAQEAFLSAWHNLGRLKNPSSFLPWLRQITRNLAHDHLRSNRNRAVDGEAAELAIQHAADPGSCPQQQLIDDERDAIAADLISELPEESREVLLLYYREGQSSKQVAHLLGLSDAAVRKRLSRARASVRDDLLTRFSDFARASAPSAAFVVGITAAIGFSKPAAAATLGMAGKSIAGGLFAKLAMGSAGVAAGGIAGGIIATWLCRKVLERYADNEAERRAIVAFYRVYIGTSLLLLLAIFGVHWLFQDNLKTLGAVLVALAVMNYQMLVPLPRLMNPLLRRDAERDPEGAAMRQLGYRLTFGLSGVLVSNLVVVGMLVIGHWSAT